MVSCINACNNNYLNNLQNEIFVTTPYPYNVAAPTMVIQFMFKRVVCATARPLKILYDLLLDF